MSDSKREQLIEAATWALIDYDTDVVDRGVSDDHYSERRADAERVWAVFEHAHTSTVQGSENSAQNSDDEREAPEAPVHYAAEQAFAWQAGWEAGWEAALRRPVQGEPTDAQVEAFRAEWWAAKDERDDGSKVRRGLRAAFQEGENRAE